MVRVAAIDWTDASIEHIARHGVDPDEVDEVVFGPRYATRSRNNTYRLVGRTLAGRYLTVILAPRGGGLFYVVTARDANPGERRAFLRR